MQPWTPETSGIGSPSWTPRSTSSAPCCRTWVSRLELEAGTASASLDNITGPTRPRITTSDLCPAVKVQGTGTWRWLRRRCWETSRRMDNSLKGRVVISRAKRWIWWTEKMGTRRKRRKRRTWRRKRETCGVHGTGHTGERHVVLDAVGQCGFEKATMDGGCWTCEDTCETLGATSYHSSKRAVVSRTVQHSTVQIGAQSFLPDVLAVAPRPSCRHTLISHLPLLPVELKLEAQRQQGSSFTCSRKLPSRRPRGARHHSPIHQRASAPEPATQRQRTLNSPPVAPSSPSRSRQIPFLALPSAPGSSVPMHVNPPRSWSRPPRYRGCRERGRRGRWSTLV